MIFKKSEIEVLCGYPRPDFRRESALLNQDWFRFSFGRVGDAEAFMERFFAGETFSDRERPLETEMPFVLPAAEAAPFTVFVKRFSVKTIAEKTGCTVLRICSGTWYGNARFSVNGRRIADSVSEHETVCAEISLEALHASVLSVAVCIEPRDGCAFVGFGQPFWMEFCGSVFLNRFVHRYENGVSQFRLSFSAEPADFSLKIPEFGWEGNRDSARREETAEFVLFCDYRECGINPPEWTPSQPHLLEIEIDTTDSHGVLADRVRSYIGLRSVSVSQSFVLLNGKPFALRGVIHAGLYDDGLPYPSSRGGYFKDAMAVKNLGFNTVRYDSRIENPAAYFCADAVGLTVWQDFPDLRGVTENDVEESKRKIDDCIEILSNYPSVIVYAVFNENRGLPKPFFRRKLIRRLDFFYSFLKMKDPSRLIVDNSGFYHRLTDILDLHCLSDSIASLRKYLESVDRREFSEAGLFDFRRRFSQRLKPQSEWTTVPDGEIPVPVILSETGGIRIDAQPDEQTVRFLKEMFALIAGFPSVKGFCFRQFADTPNARSGILREDRLIKGSTDFWKSMIAPSG